MSPFYFEEHFWPANQSIAPKKKAIPMRNNPRAPTTMASPPWPENPVPNMQTPPRKQNRNEMTAAMRVNVLIMMCRHAFFAGRRFTLWYKVNLFKGKDWQCIADR